MQRAIDGNWVKPGKWKPIKIVKNPKFLTWRMIKETKLFQEFFHTPLEFELHTFCHSESFSETHTFTNYKNEMKDLPQISWNRHMMVSALLNTNKTKLAKHNFPSKFNKFSSKGSKWFF